MITATMKRTAAAAAAAMTAVTFPNQPSPAAHCMRGNGCPLLICLAYDFSVFC